MYYGKRDIMEILKAVTLSLGEMIQPVIAEYDLCLIVSKLYQTKKFQGEPINHIKKDFPDRISYKNIKKKLEEYGIIKLQDKYFIILGKKNYDPEDVICSIDPFSYMSHLSAMSFHGLTDRIPSSLYITSPEPKKWIAFAKQKMEKDYEESYRAFIENSLPKLTRPAISKIGKYPINRCLSVHPGAFKHISGRVLRVATIGRTFLDMLRDPLRCGGMRHVIDVYKEYGSQYINLIIDEVSQHGNKIEKVRAGYLLEDRCNIKDDRIASWLNSVERGGSRKLDPSAEYSHIYSERWCLSINVD